MTPLPSLNALKAFEAVARRASFTRAAEELFVTQSAVSRQVKKLETELDVKLISRFAKKIVLTREGEILFRNLTKAFLQIKNAQKRISKKSTRLRIATPPTFATRWLIPKIPRFQKQYPELQLQVTSSMQDIELQHSNFDAVVTLKNCNADKEMRSALIFSEKLVPICSPKIIRNKSLHAPEDIKTYCLLHSLADKSEWRAWFQLMELGPVRAANEQSFEREESAIQAAIAGVGIALSSRQLIEKELADKRLIVPLEDVPELTLLSYYLTYTKTASSFLPLKQFRAWLLNEVASA